MIGHIEITIEGRDKDKNISIEEGMNTIRDMILFATGTGNPDWASLIFKHKYVLTEEEIKNQ